MMTTASEYGRDLEERIAKAQSDQKHGGLHRGRGFTGKGCRNRVRDMEAYRRNYDRIQWSHT